MPSEREPPPTSPIRDANVAGGIAATDTTHSRKRWYRSLFTRKQPWDWNSVIGPGVIVGAMIAAGTLVHEIDKDFYEKLIDRNDRVKAQFEVLNKRLEEEQAARKRLETELKFMNCILVQRGMWDYGSLACQSPGPVTPEKPAPPEKSDQQHKPSRSR